MCQVGREIERTDKLRKRKYEEKQIGVHWPGVCVGLGGKERNVVAVTNLV